MTQTDVKRLLAYSSIAHAGFILVAVLAFDRLGVAGTMFYLVAYGFMTIAAFAIVSMVRSGGSRPRTCRSGPARPQPPGGGGRVYFLLLAFAGIPLTSGFTAKYAAFSPAIATGGRSGVALVIIGVLCSVITAFVYVRIIVLMYFTEPAGGEVVAQMPSPLTTIAVTVGAGVTALGVFPAQVLELAESLAVLAMSPTPPVLALPSVSEALAERLQQGLADVDDPPHGGGPRRPFIAEAAAHLADAGKRFRPLLTPLAAEIGTGINPDVVAAATGVDPPASLYHDDVMDEADVRRGAPSANAKYDNSTAILGDLLFGTASSIIADLGPEAVKIQAQTFVRLCAGQIRDDRPCPRASTRSTTTCTCSRTRPACSSRRPPATARCSGLRPRRWRRARTASGSAWPSTADDLIDISSEAGETGKTPGTDLREGKATLPVLYARASQDPADARPRSCWPPTCETMPARGGSGAAARPRGHGARARAHLRRRPPGAGRPVGAARQRGHGAPGVDDVVTRVG